MYNCVNKLPQRNGFPIFFFKPFHRTVKSFGNDVIAFIEVKKKQKTKKKQSLTHVFFVYKLNVKTNGLNVDSFPGLRNLSCKILQFY